MYLKIHSSPNGNIVALCDEDLIGKILDDGIVYLDLDKHRSFYLGQSVSKKEAKAALTNFYSLNAVGKDSISFLLYLNIISNKDISKVNKIPYVQVYTDTFR